MAQSVNCNAIGSAAGWGGYLFCQFGGGLIPSFDRYTEWQDVSQTYFVTSAPDYDAFELQCCRAFAEEVWAPEGPEPASQGEVSPSLPGLTPHCPVLILGLSG